MSVAILKGQAIDSTLDVETTGDRRVREFLADPTPVPDMVPAVDTAALNALVGMDKAYEPKRRSMSFRVPAEWLKRDSDGHHRIRAQFWDHYEKRRKDAMSRWIGMLDREGFDLHNTNTYRLTFSEGYYPAIDTLTGAALIGEAEIQANGWVCCRKPSPVRLELDPALLVDTQAARADRSRGARTR